jgi:hypothetical protein
MTPHLHPGKEPPVYNSLPRQAPRPGLRTSGKIIGNQPPAPAMNGIPSAQSPSLQPSHYTNYTTPFPKTANAVRMLFHISNTDTLKSTYFAYFHSRMTYGINMKVITTAVKTHLLCNRKLSELRLAQKLQIHVDIC